MLLLYIIFIMILIFVMILVYGLFRYSFYIKERVQRAKDTKDNHITKDGYSNKKILDSIAKKPYDAIILGTT